MKKLWLTLSLVLNLILIGVLIALSRGRHENSSPVPAQSKPANQSTRHVMRVKPAAAGAGKVEAAGAETASRRDLPALVVKLRAAGWPEEDLVQVVMSGFWQRRQKEQREFWRKARRGEVDPKTMSSWNERWQEEMRVAVDSVLGPGAYERYEKRNMAQMFTDDGGELDAATLDKLYVAQKDWQKKTMARSAAYQSDGFDPETNQREWATLQADYNRQLKEILGEDRYALYKTSQSGGGFGYGNQLNGVTLSDAQRLAAARVMMQFSEQQTELHQLNQAGEIDPQDYQQQLKQLQDEQYRQLKDVIGPAALARYQQNNDYEFRRIRTELRAQNFTEAQIDAAFQARQAFTERQQELSRQAQAGTPIKGDEYQAAQTALNQALTSALGEQGSLSYQKAQDYKYRQMKQYAPAWQLSPADIDKVWLTTHDYQESVQDYQKQNQAAAQQGQKIDWQQAQQEIVKLGSETEQSLRSYLGDDRYERLRRAGIIQLGQGSRRVISR